jgi:hypothetical protein
LGRNKKAGVVLVVVVVLVVGEEWVVDLLLRNLRMILSSINCTRIRNRLLPAPAVELP